MAVGRGARHLWQERTRQTCVNAGTFWETGARMSKGWVNTEGAGAGAEPEHTSRACGFTQTVALPGARRTDGASQAAVC